MLRMILAVTIFAAVACSRGDVSSESRAADPEDLFVALQAAIDRRYSFLPHSGGHTHFQRVGPESGDLVVLVRGATLPLAVWEPLVPCLVESGFQVLRYDLPGRGYSSLLKRPAGLESDVEQIDALLDGLGLERPVHLVGLASGALNRPRRSERGATASIFPLVHGFTGEPGRRCDARSLRYSRATRARSGGLPRATGPCLVPDRATPNKRGPNSADVPRV